MKQTFLILKEQRSKNIASQTLENIPARSSKKILSMVTCLTNKFLSFWQVVLIKTYTWSHLSRISKIKQTNVSKRRPLELSLEFVKCRSQ